MMIYYVQIFESTRFLSASDVHRIQLPLFIIFWRKLQIIKLIIVCCTTFSYYAFRTPRYLRFRPNKVSHKYDIHA
jgi:hypothetical protein